MELAGTTHRLEKAAFDRGERVRVNTTTPEQQQSRRMSYEGAWRIANLDQELTGLFVFFFSFRQSRCEATTHSIA
jgi:hypothetical protein